MRCPRLRPIPVLTALFLPATAIAQPLPGTAPLTEAGDLAAKMVEGIDRFLMRATGESVANRARYWKRDFSSPMAYAASVEPNRERLRQIIGLRDARVGPGLDVVSPLVGPATVAEGRNYKVYSVRWRALAGLDGEGCLLEPNGASHGDIVVVPDCSDGILSPSGRLALRLAESGWRVIVLQLLDRRAVWTRPTNLPHREFLYRAAYELGRHPIGYEVQMVMAAIDWFHEAKGAVEEGKTRRRPVGVVGHGEGGLIAFYAAAVDERIDAVGVSGYFGPRQRLWSEPIYRNVFGLLREFGDGEIATLIAPRPVIILASEHPRVLGPPPVEGGRGGAAPGAITTPLLGEVYEEAKRARELCAGLPGWQLSVLEARGGWPGLAGGEALLSGLVRALRGPRLAEAGPLPVGTGIASEFQRGGQRILRIDSERQRRQFDQMVEHTQRVMRESPRARAEFWKQADAASPDRWRATTRRYRDYLWERVIGKLPEIPLKPGARTRLVYDEPKYRGYEVMLDVYPDVFASGILLVPKDMQPGEKRPVVVCQHGLEGRPTDVADPKVDSPFYHRFACRLAEEGFIAYAPQNPYIGGDKFRVLQRKANPLGLSLFSFIVRQHEQTLNWLESLPFVDKDRMAFYGLSYGGKTAMRVPAILERYCLSICSADYNEWIWKNASADSPYSYLFTGEYEMPEFDLGQTFNYAEMSWLICPRPFMVERGHHDGVAPDEWVAYEYAKTRRRYDLLGIGDRTEIEFFNGPHTINGVGTFAFLRRHLRWPR